MMTEHMVIFCLEALDIRGLTTSRGLTEAFLV